MKISSIFVAFLENMNFMYWDAGTMPGGGGNIWQVSYLTLFKPGGADSFHHLHLLLAPPKLIHLPASLMYLVISEGKA